MGTASGALTTLVVVELVLGAGLLVVVFAAGTVVALATLGGGARRALGGGSGPGEAELGSSEGGRAWDVG